MQRKASLACEKRKRWEITGSTPLAAMARSMSWKFSRCPHVAASTCRRKHDAGRFAPHYRPHAYLFVPASQFERGEAVFREFFPVSEAVRRPVLAKAFKGYRGGLAYALKTEFQRGRQDADQRDRSAGSDQAQ